MPDAEGPRLALIRVANAVDETTEPGRCNRDNVADLVGEALADFVPVLGRRE